MVKMLTKVRFVSGPLSKHLPYTARQIWPGIFNSRWFPVEKNSRLEIAWKIFNREYTGNSPKVHRELNIRGRQAEFFFDREFWFAVENGR